MRGKGVFGDCSQTKAWPGKKTLKSCKGKGKGKGKLDNIVLIDVDSDEYDNVVIIDVPESLQQTFRGPRVLGKDRKFPFPGVIIVDDDEGNTVDHPGIGAQGGGNVDSDGNSSRSSPATDFMQNSVDADGEDCQVIWEKGSASESSKCKPTNSGKAPCRNRYGLGPDSESSSSESDCEVMEGSFGKFREQWERASQKRKYNFRNGQSKIENGASNSTSASDTHPNVEVENRTEQHTEANVCSSSSYAKFEKENFSSFVPTGDGCLGGSFNPGMKSPFVKSDQKYGSESFSWWKGGSWRKPWYPHWKADVRFRGQTLAEDPGQTYKHVSRGGTSFHDVGKNSQGPPSFWSTQEQADDQYYHRRTSLDAEQNFMGEHSNFQPGVNIHFDHRKASVLDEDAFLCKSQHSGETHVNEKVVSSDKDEEFCQAQSSCNTSPRKSHHERTGFVGKETVVSREPVLNPQPSDETQVENGVAPSEDKVGVFFEKSFACKPPSCGMPKVINENAGRHGTEKLDSEEVDVTKIKQGVSCLAAAKEPFIDSMSTNQLHDERDPLNAQAGDVAPAVQRNIINEREKLKETDEYKRAAEEEWASRQRQLQLQAEEAQRLRKRKKAESMRLLDMERRQKQRLEEVRETQKKDEENMNLKEQLRVEIRKELCKLEMTCIDMASLLRGLGIPVGGGFRPLSHEVHAAYKRALLKFHPDRASRADIRHQVEAEEKFKLISRMKEKFLLTLCH